MGKRCKTRITCNDRLWPRLCQKRLLTAIMTIQQQPIVFLDLSE